ncbi:uncharacterized protein LOC116610628 isoform X2 [Nematostella vectensis]|uniref:uncharacterized protein LOC116610628 isoform X2 n=1 Tax=Nematostella vectensis TaxID=45351 RepID=UPI0020772487|nr:uncharacterized protein LOC116610628 isoform X2 [Nematostella vectensis]XP_048578070.1 uncharacterized protein LOC116610628 isoform X2 [Nematostella vectensis]
MAEGKFAASLCDALESICGELPTEVKAYLATRINEILQLGVNSVENVINDTVIPYLAEFLGAFYRANVETILRNVSSPICQILRTYLENGCIESAKVEMQNLPSAVLKNVLKAFQAESLNNLLRLTLKVAKANSLQELLLLVTNDIILPELRKTFLTAIDASMSTLNPNKIVQVFDGYVHKDVLRYLRPRLVNALQKIKNLTHVGVKRVASRSINHISHLSRKSATAYDEGKLNLLRMTDLLFDLINAVWTDVSHEARGVVIDICRVFHEKFRAAGNLAVTEYLTPALIEFIQTHLGLSAEKQLKAMEPFFVSTVDDFIRTGRIPEKDEILEKAKEYIPDLMITTLPGTSSQTTKAIGIVVTESTRATLYGNGGVVDVLKETTVPVALSEFVAPNASLDTKRLIKETSRNLIRLANQGQSLSIQGFLHSFVDEIPDKLLSEKHRKFLLERLDECIEDMPPIADKVMEFVARHMLPILAAHFSTDRFTILAFVFQVTYEIVFCKGGSLRGRDFIKPVISKAVMGVTKTGMHYGITALVEYSVKTTGKCVVKQSSKNVGIATGKAVSKATRKALEMAGRKLMRNSGEKIVTGSLTLGGQVFVTKSAVRATGFVARELNKKSIGIAMKLMTTELATALGTTTVERLLQETTIGAGRELSKHTMRNLQKEVAKKAYKEFGKTFMKVGKETAENILPQTGQKAAEEFSRIFFRRMAHKAAKKSAKRLAKRAIKEAMKTTSKVAEETTKTLGKASVATGQGTNVIAQGVKQTSKVIESGVDDVGSAVANGASKASRKTVSNVAFKAAAKAGAVAAVTSAIVGGAFFYKDMKELKKARDEGKMDGKKYRCKRNGRIAEYATDVVSSGAVATGLALAGLSGPAGWAAIAGGMVACSGLSFLGNKAVAWITDKVEE